MRRVWIVSLLWPAALSAQPAATEPAWPTWMAGSWCAHERETRIEELWLAPAGGLMLGMSRSVSPRSTEFEGLRIEWQGGALVYLAQPQGQPAVAFRESQRGAAAVTFGNPEHDFPKRVRYWREGPRLLAEIAGPADGPGAERTIRFRYDPCPLNRR